MPRDLHPSTFARNVFSPEEIQRMVDRYWAALTVEGIEAERSGETLEARAASLAKSPWIKALVAFLFGPLSSANLERTLTTDIRFARLDDLASDMGDAGDAFKARVLADPVASLPDLREAHRLLVDDP